VKTSGTWRRTLGGRYAPTFRWILLAASVDWKQKGTINFKYHITRGADKSLARPTSRCILFDGENISFDASLVAYINSTNIPPIMIINRVYETQNLLSLYCFLPDLAKDLSAPLYCAVWRRGLWDGRCFKKHPPPSQTVKMEEVFRSEILRRNTEGDTKNCSST